MKPIFWKPQLPFIDCKFEGFFNCRGSWHWQTQLEAGRQREAGQACFYNAEMSDVFRAHYVQAVGRKYRSSIFNERKDFVTLGFGEAQSGFYTEATPNLNSKTLNLGCRQLLAGLRHTLILL